MKQHESSRTDTFKNTYESCDGERRKTEIGADREWPEFMSMGKVVAAVQPKKNM
jgi:hypothetical protein